MLTLHSWRLIFLIMRPVVNPAFEFCSICLWHYSRLNHIHKKWFDKYVLIWFWWRCRSSNHSSSKSKVGCLWGCLYERNHSFVSSFVQSWMWTPKYSCLWPEKVILVPSILLILGSFAINCLRRSNYVMQQMQFIYLGINKHSVISMRLIDLWNYLCSSRCSLCSFPCNTHFFWITTY